MTFISPINIHPLNNQSCLDSRQSGECHNELIPPAVTISRTSSLTSLQTTEDYLSANESQRLDIASNHGEVYDTVNNVKVTSTTNCTEKDVKVYNPTSKCSVSNAKVTDTFKKQDRNVATNDVVNLLSNNSVQCCQTDAKVVDNINSSSDLKISEKINIAEDISVKDGGDVSDSDWISITSDDNHVEDGDDADEEEEESYYSDDSFDTFYTDSGDECSTDDTLRDSSDSAIGTQSFCVNPFFV